MNAKEKQLKNAIKEYSSNMLQYGKILSDIVIIFDKIETLESNLVDINKILDENKDTKLRNLSFIQDIENLPTIKTELIRKLKERLK